MLLSYNNALVHYTCSTVWVFEVPEEYDTVFAQSSSHGINFW